MHDRLFGSPCLLRSSQPVVESVQWIRHGGIGWQVEEVDAGNVARNGPLRFMERPEIPALLRQPIHGMR